MANYKKITGSIEFVFRVDILTGFSVDVAGNKVVFWFGDKDKPVVFGTREEVLAVVTELESMLKVTPLV